MAKESENECISSNNFRLSNVNCINLSKCPDPINTGVGFFDHMLDQLNSHAQVGISVTVDSTRNDGPTDFTERNRYANPVESQGEIVRLVGHAIGYKINSLFANVEASLDENTYRRSRFCCPLDEALVECIIIHRGNSVSGGLPTFQLAPYGEFPLGGRTKIGSWGTAHVETFFEALSSSMNVEISLVKIRGENGHHVVESAFKAFSRALRNFLDGVDIDSIYSSSLGEAERSHAIVEEKKESEDYLDKVWGNGSDSFKLGAEMMRQGMIERSTKETSILVDAKLYPEENKNNPISIQTGIQMLDIIFTEIASQSGMQLKIICDGDLYVDDHHSAEDVAIAFGQVLNKALGTKAGLNRMWLGKAKEGDCEVEVTMDLSNRPCLTSDLSLKTISPTNEEKVKDLSVEMIDHAFDSIVMNGHMTVHIVEKASKSSESALEDLTVASARAFGRALKMCTAVDPRRKGATASSKGTLSV